MVQFCASVVTSDDPIFSPREIDNALGLTTLGGEMLAVLADVPWQIVELRPLPLFRQREAERSPATAHSPSRYGHRRSRSALAARHLDTVYSMKVEIYCFTLPDILLRLTYITSPKRRHIGSTAR
jgi:hypothetical protein